MSKISDFYVFISEVIENTANNGNICPFNNHPCNPNETNCEMCFTAMNYYTEAVNKDKIISKESNEKY